MEFVCSCSFFFFPAGKWIQSTRNIKQTNKWLISPYVSPQNIYQVVRKVPPTSHPPHCTMKLRQVNQSNHTWTRMIVTIYINKLLTSASSGPPTLAVPFTFWESSEIAMRKCRMHWSGRTGAPKESDSHNKWANKNSPYTAKKNL